jgi:myo-inositol-1(or 4)-monophosphatase
MSDDTDRTALARRAAQAGAEVAHDLFRVGVDIETKDGKTDFVTQADRDAQRRVIEVIREEYLEDAIVGEEEDELKAVPETGDAWVIDPIDGTNNFVREIGIWATSVAAIQDGETVAAANVLPALGDTYVAGPDGTFRNGKQVTVSDREDPETMTVVPTIWWDFDHREEYARATRAIVERFGDMRRLGCAQAVLAMIAAGSLDGAITDVVVNPWDSVAGVYMVRQAGGRVTDLDGDPWEPGCRGLVASNGVGHDPVLAAAREIRA